MATKRQTASNNMSAEIGTPFSQSATKVMLCGSGELGKEVVIELQRLGAEVTAIDSYENAPAMQVADNSYVVDMLNEDALRDTIKKVMPHYIIPEVEAIATDVFIEAAANGIKVIPDASAVKLTMNREGIRRLASEKLGIKTSKYTFANSYDGFVESVEEIGMPCVVKPIMSSSGKGQSVVREHKDILSAWEYSQSGGRSGAGKVIVEELIDFDYEITLLTVRHIADYDPTPINSTSFCEPIGHKQVGGDYVESWQPQPMSDKALERSKQIAFDITEGLGGYGLFGVELFVKGDDVWFSEVSPRPHDTGLVTLISQDLSEFALHVRAILGLPIPNITQHGPSASHVIKVKGSGNNILFSNLDKALKHTDTQLRLFGKPSINGERRMGVVMARGDSIQEARDKAEKVVSDIGVDILVPVP
jgi:phosphoribosylglycinamide formyltransferase 2